MNVTETITRDCCWAKDLRPYLGTLSIKADENVLRRMRFCVHCGQVRIPDASREPCFERDDVLCPVVVP